MARSAGGPALVYDNYTASAYAQARLKDQLAAEGVMSAIKNGVWNDSLQKRLNEPEAQQAALRDQLQAAASPAPVVRLHPTAAALYATKVEFPVVSGGG